MPRNVAYPISEVLRNADMSAHGIMPRNVACPTPDVLSNVDVGAYYAA
jgi:hypothetical protein